MRSIDKSQISVSSKVLSCDKVAIRKTYGSLPSLAFFSTSDSLLPAKTFLFFKDTCQV